MPELAVPTSPEMERLRAALAKLDAHAAPTLWVWIEAVNVVLTASRAVLATYDEQVAALNAARERAAQEVSATVAALQTPKEDRP